MGMLSSLGSFIKAVATTAVQVARATVQAVREISATVLVWMGESGEAIIGGVQKVWAAVRPYVDHARRALRVVAQHSSVHWLAAAAHGFDRVLGALTAFERSPVAHFVDWLLNWMIRKGKELKERARLSAERDAYEDVEAREVHEAEQAGEALRIVMAQVPAKHHAGLMPAAILAETLVVSGKLNEILAGERVVDNVEFYLQVRAMQNLIRSIFESDSTEQDAAHLDDSYFLAQVAGELVDRNVAITAERAERLDAILFARTGMHLDAFVLQELVPVFAARFDEARLEWDAQNVAVSQAVGRKAILESSKNDAGDVGLHQSEQQELDQLTTDQPGMKAELDRLDDKKRFADMCAGAAEGLVKMLEQSLEGMPEDEVEFIQSEIAYIGPLLTRCFKDPDGWGELSNEECSRLVEYAVQYLDAMKARILKLRT